MINASGEIRSQVADGVATFVISRPERRNALTSRLYRDLARGLILAGEDPAIRVILLQGDGDAFIGANDIDELIANQPILMDSEDFLAMPLVADLDAPVFAFLRARVESAKPIVAAVDGPAIGLGTAILLHCDLVYGSDRARFQLPLTALGLSPEGGSTLLLPRLTGYQKAAELLMFGEAIDATTALRLGLLNAVLPAADLHAYAGERARTLATKPPGSVQVAKRLLRKPGSGTLLSRIAEEAHAMAEQMGGETFRHAVSDARAWTNATMGERS